MTVTWPTRGKALGGLDAKAYVDDTDDDLAQQIADVTAGSGDMRNADNLAFLADFAVARGFLDVFSTTETDTAIRNALAGAGIGISADPIWDTKGDLAVATGADTAAILGVGANGYVLTADSSTLTGLAWAPAPGGGTPGANTVTNAILADVATATIKGRVTAGTGDPEDLTAAQVKTVLALTKSDVGLENVDNTADSAKTFTESQITGLAADLAGKASATLALGGDMTGSSLPNPTIAAGAVTLAKMATLAANSFIGNNTGSAATPIALSVAQAKTLLALTKTDVGLGNVDNTADSAKPVSTAQQTALDLKANLASPTFSGTVALGGATVTGLTAAEIPALAASAITSGTMATARLGSGTASSATFLRGDQTWATPAAATTVVNDTLWDVKGDLAVGTGADTAARLAAGANGQILAADSSTATGLKWIAAGGGGDLLAANNLSELSATASTVRSNLGLVIGTNVQAFDAELAAIAGLTSAANKGIHFTGAGTAATHDLTAFALTLLDDTTQAAARATLGLTPGTDVQAFDADLSTLAGLTATTDNFIVSVASAWASRTPAQVKTTLAITESDVSGLVTDLSNKQPLDADLTTIASLTATTDSFIQAKAGAWASRTVAQVKTDLGVPSLPITESDVTNLVADLAAKQPLDTDLTTLAGLTATTDNFIVSVASAWASRTPAQVRTTLGLVVGTDVQPFDTELTAIAGLTSSADRLPYFTGSGTASLATFTAAGRALVDDADATAQRVTLGLVIGTNVQAFDTELAALASTTSATDTVPYFTGSGTATTTSLTAAGRALIDDADAAAQRTTLSVYSQAQVASVLGNTGGWAPTATADVYLPTPVHSEQIAITVKATGGTFTITFSGQTTSALAYNAAAGTVQTAFQALSNVGSGNATVTGGPGDSAGTNPYVVSFVAAMAGTAVGGTTTTNAGSLTGSTHTAAVAYRGILTGGVVHGSSLQMVQNYSQSASPADYALGSAVRLTWNMVATDSVPFVGPGITPLGPGIPGATFQLQGEVQVGSNQTRYSFSPIGFQNSLMYKNVPGGARTLVPGWDFLSERRFSADGAVVAWRSNDTTRGGASFIDNQLWVTQNGGESDGTTNVSASGEGTIINSFTSVPFVLGNSHFDQRIAYDVVDLNGGAGPDGDPFAGTATDFAYLTGILGAALIPGIDTASVVVNKNIGIRIQRMVGGTHNIGVQNASGTQHPPLTVAITAAGSTIPHHPSYVSLAPTSALTLTSPTVPTMTDGLDGQVITLTNTAAFTVTLNNDSALIPSNLRIFGATVTLNQYDSITFRFLAVDGLWHEETRSNNGYLASGDTANRLAFGPFLGKPAVIFGGGGSSGLNLFYRDSATRLAAYFVDTSNSISFNDGTTDVSLGARLSGDTNDRAILGTYSGVAAMLLGDGSLTAGNYGILTQTAVGQWTLSQAALKASIIRGTTTKTANWTFALADASTTILYNSASAATGTIPLNSSVAFPIGTELAVSTIHATNGQVTIAGISGVTLEAPTGYGNLISANNPGATIRYRKRATDTWTLISSTDATGAGLSFQPLDDELTALAAVTGAADKLPYFTGSGPATAAVTDFTSFARTLLDDTTAAAMITTLGAWATPTFTGVVTATGGTHNLTDGTAAHGKLSLTVSAFLPFLSLYSNSADTTAMAALGTTSLEFGAANTARDVKLTRTGTGTATVLGTWTIPAPILTSPVLNTGVSGSAVIQTAGFAASSSDSVVPTVLAVKDALATKISTITDPNADRILFWDDSAGAYAYLTPGTNLTITGTTIDAAAGTPANDSVTNAVLANMATATIKGRTTAGTGDPEDLTAAQAIGVLGLDADIATLVLPASTTISTFGASLIDDAAASNARTTLGLAIGTDVQAWDADLDTFASTGEAAYARLASPSFSGTVAATGGAINTTDGNAAHGLVAISANALGPIVGIYGAPTDANQKTALTSNSLQFGPGGASALDIKIQRTGTTALKIGLNSTDSIGVLGATPVTQQANTVDLGTVLSNFGFRASGGNPALNLGTGALTAGTTSLGATTPTSILGSPPATLGATTTTTLTATTTTLGATTSQLSTTPTSKTVDYALVLGDASGFIVMNKATAITLTIPANSSVAYPAGTIIYFYNGGVGTLTLAITTDTLSGVTSYAAATGGFIIKRTATTWVAMKTA